MAASDFMILLVGLVISPSLFIAARAIRMGSAVRWFLAGYGAMLVGYAAGLAEEFGPEQIINVVQHAGYAVGGVCFLVSALHLRELSRSSEGSRS